jgi:1,5-anhydro-D-fructose reductase (1,5-anhydro-D-mannitol-forming)
LLADQELDAVLIATPDKLHAQQAVASMKAGKHVFVEKPMATDVESAKAMIEASKQYRVHLGVAYHNRWHSGHRKVVEMIRNGEVGRHIRHARVHYTWDGGPATNWRASPEVGRWWSLAGNGTHCLDLIRWIMVSTCGEVESLKSMISKSVWKGPHDETAIVSLRFESGATAEFCSSALFDSPSRLEIYGSNGYAICENTLGRHGAGSIRTHEGEVPFNPVNPYRLQIEDFISAIRENRSPEVDGQEGLRNVELLVAAA